MAQLILQLINLFYIALNFGLRILCRTLKKKKKNGSTDKTGNYFIQ